MVKDHGYNPPPVWTMEGKFFGSFGPASDGYFKILASLDVIIHVAIIGMLYWAFGWKAMMVGTIFWGTNSAANFYWTGGAFLRQDWLFFLVASVCLARKRYFGLAGAALMWSALLRVFPAILFAGWGFMCAFQMLRRYRFNALGKPGEPPPWLRREHIRLIAGSVIALVVLVGGSVASTGTQSYKDFVHHIKVHKDTPLTNHMGLEAMLTHYRFDKGMDGVLKGRMRWARDDNLDDPFQPWKEGRVHRAHQLRPLQYAIVLGLLIWLGWALRRTKLLWVGVPLSLVFVACLTNLTCYYYCMFIVAAVLTRARPSIGVTLMVLAGMSQILYIPSSGFYWIDDKFTAIAVQFFLVGVMMIWAYSRPFSMERLKAWWDGKPEPRTLKSGSEVGAPPSQIEA
jgi:hypothetical protein